MNPYLFPGYPYELASDQYAKFLNNLPLKMVWIRGSYGTNFSCEYITNFTISLQKKIKIPLGIYANAENWNSSYPNGCFTMSIFSLLYRGFLTKWKEFGGWNHYEL